MNIYDCRFIDSKDKVTHIKQYGNSEKEIDIFWREWWPMHYKEEPSVGKYVDCELLTCYEGLEDYSEENERKNIENLLFVGEKK